MEWVGYLQGLTANRSVTDHYHLSSVKISVIREIAASKMLSLNWYKSPNTSCISINKIINQNKAFNIYNQFTFP